MRSNLKNSDIIFRLICLYCLLLSSIRGNAGNTPDRIRLADSLYHTQPNSALGIYQEIYNDAIEEKDTIQQIYCLQRMGNIHYDRLNFPEALNFITEALFLSEKKQLMVEKATILMRLGNLYCKYGNIETGEKYILEAHRLTKHCIASNQLTLSSLLPSYQNIIEVERHKLDNASALTYLDSCFILADSLKLPQTKLVNFYRIKGSVLTAIDSLEQALYVLIPLDKDYDNRDIDDPTVLASLRNQILVASGIARVYRLQEKTDLSLKYYLKSLGLVKELKDKLDFQPYLLTEIAKLYELKGQFKLAYQYSKEAGEYTEKYLKTTSERNKGVLKVRDSYKEKLDLKEKELMTQNLVLIEKEQSILRFRIIFMFFLLFFVAGGLLLWNKMQKKRLQNEQLLIKQHAEEKAKVTLSQLKIKNKELTSYTLQLMQRDDLLNQFDTYLTNDKNKNAKSLRHARKQLHTNTWEEFEKRFVSVNEGFYEQLKHRFPDLTISDLKYCALLKLNLKGKEISQLLGVTEKSVHMARYRIRKKFELEKDDNLVEFLSDM